MASDSRKRRANRNAEPPERVSSAAQQMQAQQRGQGASFRPGEAPYGGQANVPYSPDYSQQQEYYRQQQAMQEEYARQQYAWQQEQQRLRQQQAERARVTSQTASHGAFRGYTGEIPVQGGNRGQPQPPKKKSQWGRTVAILLLVAVLGTGGAFALKDYLHRKEIHEAVSPYDNLFVPGVYVDGIDLGGMTPEQGLNSVQSQIQRRNDAWHVTLTWQGTQLAQINAGMLGMSVDIGQVLNEAWAQGHTGD